jgi:hypothetical protein
MAKSSNQWEAHLVLNPISIKAVRQPRRVSEDHANDDGLGAWLGAVIPRGVVVRSWHKDLHVVFLPARAEMLPDRVCQ